MKINSRKVILAATISAAVIGIIALVTLAVVSLSGQPGKLPGTTSSVQTTTPTTATTAGSQTGTVATTPKTSNVPNPIYVTVLTHIEEPGGSKPDYLADEDLFNEQRASYVKLAGILHERNIPFDFQSDWNFLQAVAKFDKGDNSTNGKNLVKWMHDDMGFSIDPHAHETEYNYADVAYLIKQLGVGPSTVTGGFIAYPAEDSKLEYLRSPIHGEKYNYTWQASVIWGGGTSGHTQDDLVKATGVWRPLSTDSTVDYYTDDPTGTLPDIGSLSGWQNLQSLLKLQDAGKLPDGMYTINYMCEPSAMLQASFFTDLEKSLDGFADEARDGRIVWADLPTVLSDWKTVFHSEPSVMSYADFVDLSRGSSIGAGIKKFFQGNR